MQREALDMQREALEQQRESVRFALEEQRHHTIDICCVLIAMLLNARSLCGLLRTVNILLRSYMIIFRRSTNTNSFGLRGYWAHDKATNSLWSFAKN